MAAEVRVLGPVEVVGEGGPIPLAAKHVRLLAALLVARGRACGLDELVEALWNGNAPPSARKLVQVYVSQLRKSLPDDVTISTRRGAYAVEVRGEVLDAERFERLLGEAVDARRAGNAALAISLADRALALWHGRAYGELAYDDFARAESERLEEQRLVAVEERLDALLASGRHVDVLGDALTLLDHDPYRERLHELAMLALYRLGRQADALEHYAAYRARLDDELGLEPGRAVRELQRRILAQDPSLMAAAEERTAAMLPVPPTPLVGRETEVAALRALLDRRDSRLVVLTGAGGSGKTRLALEVARQLAPSFANGARLVELAPVRDPALVVPTIAHAVGVADDPEKEPLDALAAALASQELLVLVDNAEHVREAAPGLARLAAAAPRLTLLVTSRSVLHVSGEHVFPVSPLAEEDAVELFVQRARLLDPSFALVPDNESDVREVCRRLDCLPLALELAVARIRTLTPQALRERLDRRLGVLTGGPRDLPARQQTLRETIAWSVDLLGEGERDVFSRLAVFPAGATLEAAEAVCGADLETLGALVDDHLVLRVDVGGEPRFGMLGTVREYALELLGDGRAEAELAVAEYLAQLVDDLRLSEGVDWADAVERVDHELANARAALAATAASGDTELMVRLAGGLWRYWWVRGPVGEGLEWIERALAAGEGPLTTARARALYGGAGLAWSRGDLERAKELGRAAISAALEAGSKWYELGGHTILGVVANDEGDRITARHHHQRSLELKEQLGLEPLVEKLNLGIVARDSGEYEQAIALFEDVLDSRRRNDNPGGMGFALLNLGLCHHELGDHEASRRHFQEARSCLEGAGLRTQRAYALQGLAAAEASQGHFESAARLLGEARRELDEVGAKWDMFAPAVISGTETQIRAALGDEAFEAAYATGVDPDG